MIIEGEKMKVIQVGNSRYYIQSKDDMISLAHQLSREGYDAAEIARILGVKESTVRKYLSDCW
jgi:Fic family protein